MCITDKLFRHLDARIQLNIDNILVLGRTQQYDKEHCWRFLWTWNVNRTHTIYIYLYIHIHTYICMYIYIDVYVFVYVCLCVYVYMCICVYVCIRTYVRMSVCMYRAISCPFLVNRLREVGGSIHFGFFENDDDAKRSVQLRRSPVGLLSISSWVLPS